MPRIVKDVRLEHEYRQIRQLRDGIVHQIAFAHRIRELIQKHPTEVVLAALDAYTDQAVAADKLLLSLVEANDGEPT